MCLIHPKILVSIKQLRTKLQKLLSITSMVLTQYFCHQERQEIKHQDSIKKVIEVVVNNGQFPKQLIKDSKKKVTEVSAIINGGEPAATNKTQIRRN